MKNISIKYIDQFDPLLKEVVKLGKKYSNTLGFMPDGGFVEHASKRRIIVAHEQASLVGYLMFRSTIRSSRLSIVHLCVKEKFRGKNISSLLLDKLKASFNMTHNGILLSCRADYVHANSLWERYGFICKDRVRSRSIDENYLNKWWYDFNNPDLFNTMTDLVPKIKVLLDTNIILKMRDSHINHAPHLDPRCLQADWLSNEVEFFYAPELFNEIMRDENLERAKKTRQYLRNFESAPLHNEEYQVILKILSQFISGSSKNDISDRKQVATTIVSNIPYFLTFDLGIIEKRADIEDEFDIQILTPQEFILEIDQFLNKDEYSAKELKGVTFHSIANVSNEELDLYIEMFKLGFEKKICFSNLVLPSTHNLSNSKLKIIKYHNEPICFYSYQVLNNELTVPFIRLINYNKHDSLFIQIISEFISKCCLEDLPTITIRDDGFCEQRAYILEKLGFIKNASVWKKFVLRKLIASSQLGEIGNLIIDKSRIENLNDFDTSTKRDLLLKLEYKFFPLKFTDLDIPCYIIPIKPFWAGQLFDHYIAGSSLFGASPDKIWSIENIYYRSVKPITESAPARILWYASEDKTHCRSKAIIASSYLEEVMVDKPKKLFKKNKRYGIYEWDNIFMLCKRDIEKPIKALKFSRTEVFKKPVSLSQIHEILRMNNRKENTFASPVQVESNIFNDIYRLNRD